ncbi:MAG TPA: ChaN family lipoprotein [Coleofasciculaceae cyanobacterium]
MFSPIELKKQAERSHNERMQRTLKFRNGPLGRLLLGRLLLSWLLLGWLLLGVLLAIVPAIAQTSVPAQSPWRSSDGATLSADTVLNDLSQATVVYLGETHNNLSDHQAQLQIIQSLHQRHAKLAIAMEMFQRPYQAILNQYLDGKMSETAMLQQSEYEQRWGFPWEAYAPIVRFAKAQQLPVVALNTPTEVTRKVAQTGLASLDAKDRQWIPPLSEIRLDNAAYRQRIQEIYEAIHQGHSGSSGNFDDFFQAQVLWDETMADSIASFLKAHSGYQVIVLAGQGHIVYDDGIPSRVARRLQDNKNFQQRSLLLNPDEEMRQQAIADYFWLKPPAEQ